MSFHRGSYRDIGRGPGGGLRGAWTPTSDRAGSQPSQPPRPFGPELDRIGIETLFIEKDEPAIEDVEYVASYNWLNGKAPVILVPGSPPAWTPPATDPQLKPDLRGYGHTFPDAYTSWDADVRKSCSHQRIVRYTFGGLHLLVRTETDGYVRLSGSKQSSTAAFSADQPPLEDVLSTIAVASDQPSQGQQLQLQMGGTKVPQDRIFDLKTRRSSNKAFDMNEILPRLWLNQTPNFVIAYHQFGLFDNPEVKHVKQDVLKWEKANRTLLGRFHTILKRIVDVVADSDHQQCEVSWDGEGPLLITEQVGKGRRALPTELTKLFELS